MAKKIIVGIGTESVRKIDLGALKYQVEKYKNNDTEFVLYKLSFFGKYIFIKGRSLAGSLVILTDTFNSFDKTNSDRFKGHLYTHLYDHVLNNPQGRFKVDIIATVHDFGGSFYELLKQEQMYLDAYLRDPSCLNNQTLAYIPKYNENTQMYGWIPRSAVMNFNRWLLSKERKSLLKQYKK